MKTHTTLAVAVIALALLLSPMVVNAAGSITFTSPASGASYKGAQSYTISGAISPVPTQADNVGIVVKNPSGQTVDVGNVPVSSGAFSYATVTGNSANPSLWPSGTYTITATDSYGATGSTTFTYSTPTVTTFNETAILIQMNSTLNALITEVNGLKTDHTALSAQLTALANQVTTLSQSVSANQATLTQLQNTISSMNTAVQQAKAAADAASAAAANAQSAVSSTQTYVLVVAVLAAITLVLELAILIRRLS